MSDPARAATATRESPAGSADPAAAADGSDATDGNEAAGLSGSAGSGDTAGAGGATGGAAGTSGPGAAAADSQAAAAHAASAPAAGVAEAPSGIEPASIAEPGPGETSTEETDEVTVHRSLSPSRAADFMSCPLLYRFRVIDRLPEAPSAAAARGTLVHAVLERLFDEPAPGRTPAAARGLLQPQWERLAAEEPELTTLFADDEQRAVWLDEAAAMLDRYFTLEDPTRLEPAHREMSVQTVLESGLTLRGYIDRLDVARTGEVRVVDYKTGTAPREEYEARALFQMKFYALVLWRTSGVVPRQLQLIYLGNGEIMRWAPDEADLLSTERKVNALWQAIERARDTGDWRPRPSRLCDWCSHQAICPAFGGTPPPLPADAPPADRPSAAAAAESASGASAAPADVKPPSGPALVIPAQPGPADSAAQNGHATPNGSAGSPPDPAG